MSIGRLRHYMSYQNSTPTVGDYNEDEDTYTSVANVWAAIEPLKGSEFEIASTLNANVSCKIRFRNMINITDKVVASDRLVDNQTGIIYNIHYATRYLETNDTWVMCLCEIDENPAS